IFPTIKEIATYTVMLEDKVKENVENLAKAEKVILFSLTKEVHVIHADYFVELKKNITEELEKFHQKYPLKAGMSKEEIRSKFLGNIKPKVGDRFIDLLIEKNYIGQEMENLYIKGFEIKYNPTQLKIKDDLIKIYKDSIFTPIKKEDLSKTLGYDKNEVDQVFNSLISNGEIIKLNEEIYLHKINYEEGLTIVKDYIRANGS